jgi:hypothetical protein
MYLHAALTSGSISFARVNNRKSLGNSIFWTLSTSAVTRSDLPPCPVNSRYAFRCSCVPYFRNKGARLRAFQPHTQQWHASSVVRMANFFLVGSVGAQIGHLTSKLRPFPEIRPRPKIDS